MKTAITEKDYIHRLIAEGEHIHQDFKFAISDARKIARSLSAFANTEGGRLLVGVKDNGSIAGVRSEEEIYMIDAAATMYCRPPLQTESKIYKVEGKDVLEVVISEQSAKPVYALDEDKKPWAYIRIADENILADRVHLETWNREQDDKKVLMSYTPREQSLLNLLAEKGQLTLNQCAKLSGIPRNEASKLLSDFIRFGLVDHIFSDHHFYFRLSDSEDYDNQSKIE